MIETLEIQKAKIRGFEMIAEDYIPEEYKNSDSSLLNIQLPKRATKKSAAYDFFSATGGTIAPGQKMYFPTFVKAYMQPGEVLLLWPRSSQGIKLDLALANTTGVVDSDYYNNPDNDGHIGIYLRNLGKEPVYIKAGDKLAQGMFTHYLLADHDDASKLPERMGGVGHTGR